MTITADGTAVQDVDGVVHHPRLGESVEALLARLQHGEKDAVMRAPLRESPPLHPSQLPGCYD